MANELFLDNFTDTNGVSLHAHTPDIAPSGGWTEALGDFDIQSNMANFVSGSADPSLAHIDLGSVVDCYIELAGTMGNTTGTTNSALVLRYVDTSNYLFIVQSAGSGLQLFENVAGTPTALAGSGTPGISAGEVFTLRVVLTGNIITAAIRGASAGDVGGFSWEGTRFNTATRIGIRCRQSGTVTSNNLIDRLSVWPLPTSVAGGITRARLPAGLSAVG